MRSRLGWLAVLVLAFGATGCLTPEEKAKLDAEKKAEFDKLNGRWRVTFRDGEAEDFDDRYVYVIENETLKTIFVHRDGREEVDNRQLMRLNWRKEPKQVDLVEVDDAGNLIGGGPAKRGANGKRRGGGSAECKQLGVYKVDGDALTLCATYEATRPTDFTAPHGSYRYVLKLERVKDAPKPAEEPKKDN